MVLIGAFAVTWDTTGSNAAQPDNGGPPDGPSQNSSSGHAEETGKTDQPACLQSDDKIVRRRAIWQMASNKTDPRRIVDAVISDPEQGGCCRVIMILGASALPRLYQYLADADGDTRRDLLTVIAVTGSPDASALEALQNLSGERPDDKELQVLVELIMGPSPAVADKLMTTLQSTSEAADRPWSTFGAECLLATQEKTRDWAINRARMHLNQAIANLHNGKFTPNELERLMPKVLLLAFAARSRPLGQRDRECLQELESELSKTDDEYDVVMPALVMTRWMAGGKEEPGLLDKAIALFGSDEIGGRVLYAETTTFADVMLSPDDIAVLLPRAKDERAKEQVRIGSLRLLGWLGSTDDRVHKTYLDLLKSEREPIRLAAAQGLALLIEGPDRKGTLLEAARARLSVEKSQPVLDALTFSVERITACP